MTTFASLDERHRLVRGRNDGPGGRVEWTVALNVPGVTFTGTFGVALNNTTKTINESLNVGAPR